jgi:hypothetical protein
MGRPAHHQWPERYCELPLSRAKSTFSEALGRARADCFRPNLGDELGQERRLDHGAKRRPAARITSSQ